MVLLLLVSALLSTAAPNTGGELLDADDESLLRAMAEEPARVLAHIRAQQRRLELTGQQQVTPEANVRLTSQGRRWSGAEQELRPESSNQRAVNTLGASSSDGCSACQAAAACYSHACQRGKMDTDGPFVKCADVPRAICDMYGHVG